MGQSPTWGRPATKVRLEIQFRGLWRGRPTIGHLRHVPQGPQLEGAQSWKGVKFLELGNTCSISIYLSNCSGCARNFAYIWSRTLDLNNAVPLLESLKEYVTWLYCKVHLICWNWTPIGKIRVKGLQRRCCSTENLVLAACASIWRDLRPAPRRRTSLSPRESFRKQIFLPTRKLCYRKDDRAMRAI